jgi:hypothetical protein
MLDKFSLFKSKLVKVYQYFVTMSLLLYKILLILFHYTCEHKLNDINNFK